MFGANIFVDGSTNLARKLKVSPLIIGLTIVACGTSAPELIVSSLGAYQGSSEIALSNITGSNTVNLLGILGICSLIAPLVVKRKIIYRDFLVSTIATLLLFLLTVDLSMLFTGATLPQDSTIVGVISRGLGIFLILAYVIYIIFLIKRDKDAKEDFKIEEDVPIFKTRKCVIYIVGGLIMIILGGEAVVSCAESIARMAGISETFIAYTIVAIGTSLPELVTSIVATKKGQLEIAIGNVIGSNIFNLLFILGVSAIIRPIEINLTSGYDFIILIAVTIISAIFGLTGGKIKRLEGLAMLGIYALITVF